MLYQQGSSSLREQLNLAARITVGAAHLMGSGIHSEVIRGWLPGCHSGCSSLDSPQKLEVRACAIYDSGSPPISGKNVAGLFIWISKHLQLIKYTSQQRLFCVLVRCSLGVRGFDPQPGPNHFIRQGLIPWPCRMPSIDAVKFERAVKNMVW